LGPPCFSQNPTPPDFKEKERLEEEGVESLYMQGFPNDFDANGPAIHSGIFGLPQEIEDPRIPILPVPWEATCSYGRGTSGAPEAILKASFQVDLEDPVFGPTWEKGIRLDPCFPWLSDLAIQARTAATHSRGTHSRGTPMDPSLRPANLALVRGLSAIRTEAVRDWVFPLLHSHKPGVLGGDHSCALGAFLALEKQNLPFSVLQIDAHFDLRDAYEGFQESHASVMNNLLKQCSNLVTLVQIGIRDFSKSESGLAKTHPKIHPHILPLWRRKMLKGHPFSELLEDALEDLTSRVWISFDIDGLDPWLCPHTGTPVPGGLSFDEASWILEALSEKGFNVLGFDLCEVGHVSNGNLPQGGWEEWDSLVGARILYKICGAIS
jgi:agmatinase